MSRLLAAMGVGVAVLAAAACGGHAGPSPAALVAESVTATQKVKSFHFTIDVEGVPRTSSGLQLTSAEGDAIVPDRLRAQVSGNFSGIPLTTDLVSVAGKLWIKNPLSGSWMSVDVGTTPAFLLDPKKGVLGVMQAVTGLRRDGSEDVGGVAAYRVTGRAAAAKVGPLVAVTSGTGTVEVTMWLGKDDKILRRVRVAGPVASGEPADASRVVEVSRFGESVQIEAPKGAT
jgi:lipoprotein LprG